MLSNHIATFEKVGGEGSNISEFTPIDENGDKLSGEVSLQFFNEYGKLIETYAWFKGEDIDEGFEDGWYDDNQDEVKDRTILAGEGFCITTTYTGAFLKFKAIGGK